MKFQQFDISLVINARPYIIPTKVMKKLWIVAMLAAFGFTANAQTVKEEAKETANQAGQTLDKAADEVGQEARETRREMKKQARKADRKIDKATDDAKDKAEEVRDDAKKGLNKAERKVKKAKKEIEN